MAWIILEGLDRSGKSSAAEYYKSLDYQYIHMDAPDKKYSEPGYTGPSYIDEMVDLYTSCDGSNVVFDRSIYGEKVWPAVFGRDAKLDYGDFDILQDFENKNETEYILMWDQNFDAHWDRCVANDEPLNRGQFNHAVAMYERLENNGFTKKQLPEFKEVTEFIAAKEANNSKEKAEKGTEETSGSTGKADNDVMAAKDNKRGSSSIPTDAQSASVEGKTVQQIKLDKANAINTLLSARVIKRKGDIYDMLEDDIRTFLQDKLGKIFGTDSDKDFTQEEKLILKLYANRILEKQKEQ